MSYSNKDRCDAKDILMRVAHVVEDISDRAHTAVWDGFTEEPAHLSVCACGGDSSVMTLIGWILLAH